MRITLGNINGKAYGLNTSEACVYAAIEKCSRGDNAKGWYGTMEALAASIPCAIYRTTVSRAVAKLLNLGIIRKEGEGLYASVQNAQNDVQIAHENVQIAHENVQIAHENVQIAIPPITPLYNNKEMKEEIKEQPRADMRTRDGANQQPSGSDLINSFYSFRNAWLSAGGVTAEFERRSTSLWVEWKEMPAVKRQTILNNLSRAVMVKQQPDNWKDNPLFFLRDYPEPQPTNYNGRSHPSGEPMVIAKHNGVGGVFTRRDAELFGMTDMIDLNV